MLRWKEDFEKEGIRLNGGTNTRSREFDVLFRVVIREKWCHTIDILA